MKKLPALTCGFVAMLTLAVSTTLAQAAENFGVLLMAHGGSAEWDASVLATAAPLREHYPVEVAFGMADAASLQDAAAKLEAQGVDTIAVIKLFISGESWHERTRQILGLSEGAPPRPDSAAHEHAPAIETPDPAMPLEQGGTAGTAQAAHEHGDPASTEPDAAPGEAGGHDMAFWQLASKARFRLSVEGLAEAAETGEILLDRALALSTQAAQEDILLLAHGPENDAENARWLQHMQARAEPLGTAGFHTVKAVTLREDWPEKRAAAETEIRAFVAAANAAGRTVIVLPFRVHGFGPYAEILDGLEYVSDQTGLIPHPAISRWIQRQVGLLR
jgi:sirohydrochlorin ferrochelatase